jgi:voltage-gated potassium channel
MELVPPSDPTGHRAGPVHRDPYVIVAGFGLPGRCLVETLRRRNIKYCVIELNEDVCQRVAAGGINIISGDASDLETLRRAGAERASLIALVIPNDEIVLRAVSIVRLLNPTAQVIARCAFTSTGLEAVRRGASHTIVAEQVVATHLNQLAEALF